MKEKETKKSSKTAFQKILNYLLFEDFKTPAFSSEYVNLSESFLEYNSDGALINEKLSLKLNEIFKIQLLNLDSEDRSEIIDSFLTDKNSYDGLLFIFTMEVHKRSKLSPSKSEQVFLKMMFYYQLENKINDYLIIYFKQYFCELYESKFSKTNQISEQEYKSILKIHTTKESIL